MDCAHQLHMIALHAEHGYRSFTPGLGELCRSDDRLLGFGAYQNSIGKGSAYLAGGWQPMKVNGFRIGAIGGFVTGYRPYAVPMAAAFISYGDIHLTLIPPMKGKTPATMGVSFTWH